MPYYNTTNLAGGALKKAKNKTLTQKERVLSIFQFRKLADLKIGLNRGLLSPSQCWKIYQLEYGRTPITSIRRSITDLTNDGYLEKTGFKSLGEFGRPEYNWQIKDQD
jgi:hypothetical protein